VARPPGGGATLRPEAARDRRSRPSSTASGSPVTSRRPRPGRRGPRRPGQETVAPIRRWLGAPACGSGCWEATSTGAGLGGLYDAALAAGGPDGRVDRRPVLRDVHLGVPCRPPCRPGPRPASSGLADEREEAVSSQPTARRRQWPSQVAGSRPCAAAWPRGWTSRRTGGDPRAHLVTGRQRRVVEPARPRPVEVASRQPDPQAGRSPASPDRRHGLLPRVGEDLVDQGEPPGRHRRSRGVDDGRDGGRGSLPVAGSRPPPGRPRTASATSPRRMATWARGRRSTAPGGSPRAALDSALASRTPACPMPRFSTWIISSSTRWLSGKGIEGRARRARRRLRPPGRACQGVAQDEPGPRPARPGPSGIQQSLVNAQSPAGTGRMAPASSTSGGIGRPAGAPVDIRTGPPAVAPLSPRAPPPAGPSPAGAGGEGPLAQDVGVERVGKLDAGARPSRAIVTPRPGSAARTASGPASASSSASSRGCATAEDLEAPPAARGPARPRRRWRPPRAGSRPGSVPPPPDAVRAAQVPAPTPVKEAARGR